MAQPGDLTELLNRVHAGDQAARDCLFAAAYGDLRRVAHARLFHGGRSTCLDTTALVHESYLRLQDANSLRAGDRRAFLAYASQVMRSVIIDAVRERQAERRGGHLQRVTLGTQGFDSLPADEGDVLAIHAALAQLSQVEPRLAQVVEMRYFGGYSDAEVAEALELTDRTVRREWDKARVLLMAMLET
jgi:RNA polymerase sigma factor (TIGR02999 family)